MNKVKFIGVLGRPTLDDENNSLVGIYEGFRTSIIKKGYIPLLILPLSDIDYYNTKTSSIPDISEHEKEIYRNLVNMCSGIIVPGGYRWYNYDEYVVKYAIECDIPVLGICMGMQLLANIDNPGCVKLNETDINHSQRGEKYVHDVEIVNNTYLYKIIGQDNIRVNSKHRYHVDNVNDFIVSAYAPDNLIEAIELPDKKFVLGLQWHPEMMLDYDENANKLFDEFIRKCNIEKEV